MLDINFIRQNPQQVKEGLMRKKVDVKLINRLLRFDESWRNKTNALEQLKAEQNVLNKQLAKSKNPADLTKAKILKERLMALTAEQADFKKKRDEILTQLPNLPSPETPDGEDENDNVVVREWGQRPLFDFKPLDYLTLGQKLDLIDIERAAKVSGSRFGYLKNEAVLLEFALVKFAFDFLIKKNFIPVVPPPLIREEMMKAMGFIDRQADREEAYFLEKDKLYLIATAEQSIGPMHAREVFAAKDLPKRYVGFSPCFRREAGSYGKDTKGILRVHHFDKIEMFVFCRPDQTNTEFALLLDLAEKLMQQLEIPYRVVQICAGDLGQTAAARFDLEAWLPGQNQYRETHSISNIGDFQARRLNICYRSLKEKSSTLSYVHTLNGTALAIGRTIVAIIENYQTAKGTIKIPTVLKEYIGKDEIKPL